MDTTCTACPLHLTAKHFVPGEGPTPARVMVVGEGPGKDEDQHGKPFVGRSGVRLDALLSLTPYKRSDVYVTNVIKHRTSVTNRAPRKAEIAACHPLLMEELRVVKPDIIITLGGTAAKVFDPAVKLDAKDHGKARLITFHGMGYILVPMFHPAYSLHNPGVYQDIITDFKRLSKEIGDVAANPTRSDYPVVSDKWAYNNWESDCSPSIIGFDLETTSPTKGLKRQVLNVQETEIVGYSYAIDGTGAWYVAGQPDHFITILEDDRVRKVCHRAGFEFGRLAALGIELTNFVDTKLAAYLLGHRSTHLKGLSRQILGVDPITFKELTAEAAITELTPEEIAPYAAADSDNTLRLWGVLEQELKRWGLEELYYKVELPCIPVLTKMEERGVGFDAQHARLLVQELELEVEKAAATAYVEGLPGAYSISSNEQVAKALEHLNAPLKKRTEAKKLYITDEPTLLSIRGWNEPLIDSILAYRGMRKLLGYVDGYLGLVGKDGRLHPSWNQAGHVEENVDVGKGAPATGRMSCSGPNLQQAPNHGVEEGWMTKVRNCIVARPGHVLVSGDISQEEPRITALLTKDVQLNADFKAGVPIYAPMGRIVYGYDIGKNTHKREWHVAKQVFLALCYGAEWKKLMELDPTITEERAKTALRQLRQRYLGITALVPSTREELTRQGYVRDIFGRVRWFPAFFTADRDEALRQAVNFKIQGPGGTIIKLCLQRVDAALPNSIILAIHDDITLEVADTKEAVARAMLALTTMTTNLYPGLVLPVEVKVAKRWGEL